MHGCNWSVATAVLDADVMMYPLVLGFDFMITNCLLVNVQAQVYLLYFFSFFSLAVTRPEFSLPASTVPWLKLG